MVVVDVLVGRPGTMYLDLELDFSPTLRQKRKCDVTCSPTEPEGRGAVER